MLVTVSSQKFIKINFLLVSYGILVMRWDRDVAFVCELSVFFETPTFFCKIVQIQWKLAACSRRSHNLISAFGGVNSAWKWPRLFLECAVLHIAARWQVEIEFSASLKQIWAFQESPV